MGLMFYSLGTKTNSPPPLSLQFLMSISLKSVSSDVNILDWHSNVPLCACFKDLELGTHIYTKLTFV
jgi:hypothetical protein